MKSWSERAKAAFAEMEHTNAAKTDESVVSKLLAVSAVPTNVRSIHSIRLSSVLAVSVSAVFEKLEIPESQPYDPDQWCWPFSSAMTSTEINTFASRLQMFTDKGIGSAESEVLADKLVLRDREKDDRQACPECKYFAKNGAESWVCGNSQRVTFAFHSRNAQLPNDFWNRLHRCNGYSQSIHIQRQIGVDHGQT